MSKSLHRLPLRYAFIAGLTLLFAQLGAMAHVYSHGLDAIPPTQHAQQSSHGFCGDCLNFAPLLTTAGAPTALPLIAPRVPGAVSLTVFLFQRGYPALLAFRSRAPPNL